MASLIGGKPQRPCSEAGSAGASRGERARRTSAPLGSAAHPRTPDQNGHERLARDEAIQRADGERQALQIVREELAVERVYEALPEPEELDPERVRRMVGMAFAQNEVDHASRAEEILRSLLVRVRHEANRSPEYVEQQHAQAVSRQSAGTERGATS